MSDSNSRAKRGFMSALIEPFLQLRLGIYFIGVSLLFLSIAVFLIGYTFYKQYEHIMSIFNVVDPSAQWELITNEVVFRNSVYLAVWGVVYVLSLLFVVFKMTHRIYGPLVSIERFVDQLSEGQFHRRVTIRKGDDLVDLVDKLNHLAESLERKQMGTATKSVQK